MEYDPNSGLSSGPYDSHEEPPNAIIPVALSVFCLFCCCQPFGIGGLVLALLGMSKGSSGDIEGAGKFIRYSYILAGVGVGGGILIYCMAFVMVFISEMM